MPEPARAAPGRPADTEALRARWPEVLSAVQGKRRVAAIQLSHASVESFADNVLVLAFAQAGFAKGFQTGGYDKDLGEVLETLLGVTPVIRTEVLGVAGSGPAAGTWPSGAESSAGPRPGARSAADAAPVRSAGPARSQQTDAPARRSQRQPDRTPPPADAEPEPSDLPAPDVLTGTDLIERELGGRIIQELDGP